MTHIVQLKRMNKYFGKLHVLKDIDLAVEAGEVVVIIGASGSGKSTLIRCVNGLEEFESGHLEVDGHKLAPKGGNQESLAEIRKEVGLSLIHISEPTRRTPISYAVFCLKKKKKQ